MPLNNRIADLTGEITGWRHDFHAHPEVLYEVHRTAARVAELLESFGVDDVATGIGRTGVVGIIRGNRPGKMVGLRAELDALPMTEATGLDYVSANEGRMHACGHDGHMAMLLGAAKYLSETRDFAGSVALIFQPAEEGGAGGRAMAEDGLFSRWPIEEVYALHNLPGIPFGHFVTRPNAIMASADTFDIIIEGKGGHAAWPHLVADVVVAAGQIITALQTIVSRETNPLLSAVVSVTQVEAGSAHNVMPNTARLAGTVRALDAGVRDHVEKRLIEIAEGVARALNVEARVHVDRVCGVVVNDPSRTAFCAGIAAELAGADKVDQAMAPLMGGDDFCYLLEHRPGAYVFVGNGDTAGLHTVTYDFNDDLIPLGVSYWVRLVQAASSDTALKKAIMRSSKVIHIVGCHAEGEVGDVITGGVAPPPGATLWEQARFIAQDNELRDFVLNEPRGGVFRHVNLLVPPKDPKAAAGFIIMEPVHTPPMSGSNSICVATVVLDTGLVPMSEPETRFWLEAPGGLVEVVAQCRDGKAQSVRVTNHASFVGQLDATIEVEGLGTIKVDTAYGGDTFALVDANALGFALTPDEAADLKTTGMKITRAATEQLGFAHPEHEDWSHISFTQFTGPVSVIDGVRTGRSTVAIEPGKLDRSPTGTGVSARMAVLHRRGLLEVGEAYRGLSIIGTRFDGRIEATTHLGDIPAIIPSISGRAWITETKQLLLDPSDPFPRGYRVGDTWPGA